MISKWLQLNTDKLVKIAIVIITILVTLKIGDLVLVSTRGSQLYLLDLDADSTTLRTLDLYPYTMWHVQGNTHQVGPMPNESNRFYQDFDIRSNDHGFFVNIDLEKPPPKLPNEFRIILIGGSTAQGFGAQTNDDMFYKLLETRLNDELKQADIKVTIINLAMGASITYQNYITLNKWGHLLEPDLILSFSGANDLNVPLMNGSDAPYQFYVLQGSVLATRYSESPAFLKWLGYLYPGIIKYTPVGSSIRMLFLDQYVTNAREKYVNDYAYGDSTREGFLMETTMPLYVQAFRSIKRDFSGIPIMIAFQPFDMRIFEGEEELREQQYDRLIESSMLRLSNYQNDQWYFVNFQEYWWAHNLFEKDILIGAVHLTNEAHMIVTDVLTNRLVDLIKERGSQDDVTLDQAVDLRLAYIYYQHGLANLAEGNPSDAILNFDKASQIDPYYVEAYYQRGLAKLQKNDLDEAILDFDKTLMLDSQYAQAYLYRGAAKLRRKNPDEAILDYGKALAIDPQLVDAYYQRGLAKLQKNDLDEAILDFDKTLMLDPDHVETYYERGRAKAQTGDLEAGIADFDKALELRPDNWKLWADRAVACFVLYLHPEQQDECEHSLEKAKALHTNSTEAEKYVLQATENIRKLLN